MKKVNLKARIREGSGKKISHQLRSKGEIPGVLYGHGEDPVSLAVPEHEFWKILHNATTEHLILEVKVDGMKPANVLTLVKEVQHHPVTGDILHVDLQRISEDEKIKVGVPVSLVGVPKGVKDFGGILDHGAREIRVITTASTVPESLEIDVTHLQIGDSIHISDIAEKFKDIDIFDDESILIAYVAVPKKLEEIKPEEEAEEETEEAGEEQEAEPEAEKEEKSG